MKGSCGSGDTHAAALRNQPPVPCQTVSWCPPFGLPRRKHPLHYSINILVARTTCTRITKLDVSGEWEIRDGEPHLIHLSKEVLTANKGLHNLCQTIK